MNAKELIGRRIEDILVWRRLEVGGLDLAKVYLKLDGGTIIRIPWDFQEERIERLPKEQTQSLFSDMKDHPIHYVNPRGKSINEIVENQKRRNTSLFGKVRKLLGFHEVIPKDYKPYKTEYRENKLKQIKNQGIVNFLMFEDDSAGFLELENGYIITETTMAPHGTGAVGLNYYTSLKHFEESHGTDYKRLVDKANTIKDNSV